MRRPRDLGWPRLCVLAWVGTDGAPRRASRLLRQPCAHLLGVFGTLGTARALDAELFPGKGTSVLRVSLDTRSSRRDVEVVQWPWGLSQRPMQVLPKRHRRVLATGDVFHATGDAGPRRKRFRGDVQRPNVPRVCGRSLVSLFRVLDEHDHVPHVPNAGANPGA